MQDRKMREAKTSYWEFALIASIVRLEQLVWNFQTINEEVDQRGHAFAGVPQPGLHVDIIDGFLLHERENFLPGDITKLEEMRAYLQEHIIPIFQAGEEAAAQRWTTATLDEQAKLAEMDFPDFRNEGKMTAPEGTSLTEQAWFIEGFSRAWREMWTEYLRKRFEANQL
jgi:hypothetical protein